VEARERLDAGTESTELIPRIRPTSVAQLKIYHRHALTANIHMTDARTSRLRSSQQRDNRPYSRDRARGKYSASAGRAPFARAHACYTHSRGNRATSDGPPPRDMC